MSAHRILSRLIKKIWMDCKIQKNYDFPPFVADAFRKFTAPAIFGAVFGQFAMRQPKLAPFALAIPLTMLYFKLPVWSIILASVFGTIAISRVFYKAKIIH